MEPATTSAADVFSRSIASGGATTAQSTASTHVTAIGGFVVCLDVPEASEFGIDYEVFRTGSKFQGVKFVPLGLHFVVFRSRDHKHGIRQGFFADVQRHGQIVVREWSADKEELGPPRPGLNLEHLEKAVQSFQLDAGLGAYPKQHLKVWHRLSSFIDGQVLKRCGVETGAIIVPGGVDDASLNAETDNGIVPYFADQPRTVRFTTLRRRDAAAMSIQERTAYHFDKSVMLQDLLTNEFGGSWEMLLGEFQLAFVVFLQLSSLAALEHWKQMVVILCSCESALFTHTALFIAFVRALRTQLKQIPVDFFEDELSGGNFLRPSLVSLSEILSDCEFSHELAKQRDRLAQLLLSRFHLALHPNAADIAMDDDDEFAPTVVLEDELTSAPEPESNEAIAMAFLRSRRA